MNERIRELAEKASFEETTMTNFIAGPRQIFYGDEAHMQKFAELIVKECADIADKAEPYKANDLIRKHFGVEE